MGAKVWVWSEWIIAIGIQDRIQRARKTSAVVVESFLLHKKRKGRDRSGIILEEKEKGYR
jgi:predicted ribonuclease toxin of YeeF-YezG toxin-antitoxin module